MPAAVWAGPAAAEDDAQRMVWRERPGAISAGVPSARSPCLPAAGRRVCVAQRPAHPAGAPRGGRRHGDAAAAVAGAVGAAGKAGRGHGQRRLRGSPCRQACARTGSSTGCLDEHSRFPQTATGTHAGPRVMPPPLQDGQQQQSDAYQAAVERLTQLLEQRQALYQVGGHPSRAGPAGAPPAPLGRRCMRTPCISWGAASLHRPAACPMRLRLAHRAKRAIRPHVASVCSPTYPHPPALTHPTPPSKSHPPHPTSHVPRPDCRPDHLARRVGARRRPGRARHGGGLPPAVGHQPAGQGRRRCALMMARPARGATNQNWG